MARTAARGRTRAASRRKQRDFFGRKVIYFMGPLFLVGAWKAPDYIVPISLITLAVVVGGLVQDYVPRRAKVAVPLVVMAVMLAILAAMGRGQL